MRHIWRVTTVRKSHNLESEYSHEDRTTLTKQSASGLALPYRIGVGIMLVNSFGQVWVGRRRPKWLDASAPHIWQMPQGGLGSDEDAEDAAVRELFEETGVRSAEVLGRTSDWLSYDLPPELVGVALKGRYRGQRQQWFAMRFKGPDSEIRIKPPRGLKPEFDAWRWAHPSDVPALGVVYKRGLYEEVLRQLAPFIGGPQQAHPRADRTWSGRIWSRLRTAGSFG